MEVPIDHCHGSTVCFHRHVSRTRINDSVHMQDWPREFRYAEGWCQWQCCCRWWISFWWWWWWIPCHPWYGVFTYKFTIKMNHSCRYINMPFVLMDGMGTFMRRMMSSPCVPKSAIWILGSPRMSNGTCPQLSFHLLRVPPVATLREDPGRGKWQPCGILQGSLSLGKIRDWTFRRYSGIRK